MGRWRSYWQTVGHRIAVDRGAFRVVWLVTWLTVRGWIRQAGRKPVARIAYHPHPGGPWYMLPLALRYTNIKPVRQVSEADIVMIFDDRTETDGQSDMYRALPPDVPLINAGISDISKRHVARMFETVFGYKLSVNPLTHTGPMVEKSNENGVHDGVIVQGPITQPKPDCVYQKLVETVTRPGVTEDLRCTCVGGEVVQIFRKEKASHLRFSTRYLQTTLVNPADALTPEERQKISEFATRIGLDFGSIDVLRDHLGDGMIYIVDVNKTGMPVFSMSVSALETGLKRIGLAAESMIKARLDA